MDSLTGQTNYSVNMIPYSNDATFELIRQLMYADEVSKKHYLNISSAFDTETSSFIDDYTGEESALCYIWMFGIEETVVYGRELEDFQKLVNELGEFLESKNVKLITYIHFAKFDFSFIKYLFNWNTVFLKENREVLYATYRNIEFRDSLILSGGQSLENIGKNLRVEVRKAIGDLDYEKIRHSKTPLTQLEMHYCEMDIRVLEEYIREKIADDGDISLIPYTNTGYVRNYVRNECFKNRRHYSYFISGLTMTPACYTQADRAYQGGSVSANFRHIGKVRKDIHSYDIKSSYPYVMCCEYFPINYFEEVQGLTSQTITRLTPELEIYLRNYCCMFELEMWDVEPLTEYYFPISKHKCNESIETLSDSDFEYSAGGRIISALYLSITVTELDFETITEFYKCSRFRISELRIAPRGYLPDPIVKSVVKFFNDKTTLDGVKGREREYMISKNMLNSVYGMMVEKPVRPLYRFINGKGFVKDEADFVEQIVNYNEKYNRFLFYPWGVWVTAHARYRLHKAIKAVGDDFLYCDTDSVKFSGNHDEYFKMANTEAYNKVIECAKRNGIAVDYMIPKAPDGTSKVLGVWEHEYDAYTFKTLGNKRYFVEYSWREKGNTFYPPETKYEFTTSGCNKTKTLDYILKLAKEQKKSPFDIFNSSLIVPAEYSGRTVSKFIDSPMSGWVTDYLGNREYYESPSGIYVAPTSYSFSITDEMKDAIIWLTHDGHYQDGQF